jgi:hypothetical protein
MGKSIKLSNYEHKEVEISSRIQDGAQWVRFGDNDKYLADLLELYKKSKTHRRCIDSVVYYGYGENGIIVCNQSEMPYQASAFEALFPAKEQYKAFKQYRIFRNFALELITNATGSKIAEINTIPFWKVRPGSIRFGETGKIQQWYYSPEFSRLESEGSNINYKTPLEIPAFSGDELSLAPGRYLYVYSPELIGNDYIASPVYESAIADIQTEYEVSVFHLYNVKTGFSGTTVVQFNDGEPESDEAAADLEKRFLAKLTGARGQRIVFLYNNNPETKATIDNVALSDADKLFTAVDERTTQSILTAHGVTSKQLLGIDQATGFSNNAEEMMQAYELMVTTEIRAFQNEFLEGLQPILKFQGWPLQLEMKHFDLRNAITSAAPAPTETEATTELSANEHFKNLTGRQYQNLQRIIREYNKDKLTREQALFMIGSAFGIDNDTAASLLGEHIELQAATDLDAFLALGEDESSDYELIHSEKVDAKIELARVPSSSWAKESEQDTDLFRVRYKYKGQIQSDTREFCSKMLSADKVYRFEDIQAASEQRVNPGWGPRGADTYDIWLYKGGGNCHHFWERRIYLKKDNKQITVSAAQKMINELSPSERAAARFTVNSPLVAKLPIDQPNRGFLPK